MTCTIASDGSEQHWECKNEYEQPYTAIKILLLQKIRQLYTDGYTDFYVNCDQGIPMWAAEMVCALREKCCPEMWLHIVIPYEEQCRNWAEDLRDRYYGIHAQADSVTLAASHFSENSYETADMLMAENSDLVLIFGNEAAHSFLAAYAAETSASVSFFGNFAS